MSDYKKCELCIYLILFGAIVVHLTNGSEIVAQFNDSDILGLGPQKTCDIPPRNPNTNFSLAPEGCP